MGDVKFDLKNNQTHERNSEFSEFSESSLGYESFSNDIKIFTLFLQFIDKNKNKLNTFLGVNSINDNELREFSKQGEIYIGGNKQYKEENVKEKRYDISNLQQLTKKLLDKFESMKICEIFNEVHLDNNSNIRGDIMKFVNILESKLDTNNKFKFERQHKISNTIHNSSITNEMGDLLSKEKALSSIVDKNKSGGNESIKEENKTEKSELYNCVNKSSILDLNILKSEKLEPVTLSSKVTTSNNVEDATKKDVKHIGTNTDQCSGTLKFPVQNQYHNVGKNSSNKSKNGISLAQVYATSLDEKIKRLVKETIDAKLSSMSETISFNMFENDRVHRVTENTDKSLKEEIRKYLLVSNNVGNKSCPADCTSKAENQHKNKPQTDTPQRCHCSVHGSSNMSHIQECSERIEQKSVGMEKNTDTKQMNKYNPSTITVQNVSDMLFSLCSTLNNAPVCIKNERILDLNPPKLMVEVIYVLSYITNYIDHNKHITSSNYVNEEVKREDVTKVIYEKSHLILQNLITLLASSFNEAK